MKYVHLFIMHYGTAFSVKDACNAVIINIT